MKKINPFHLAIPVKDLDETRSFYAKILACPEGRSSEQWVDFDLYGHQLVIHKVESETEGKSSNPVDGHDVPVPHFGVVLEWEQWEELSNSLKQNNVQFVIEPCIRFEGQVGEQATMFFKDPSGNALEFKAFKNMEMLFAK